MRAARFIWAEASPRERAAMIRSHRGLSLEDLSRLFCITIDGAAAIMNGANWEASISTEGQFH